MLIETEKGQKLEVPDGATPEQIDEILTSFTATQEPANIPEQPRSLAQNAGDFWEGFKAGVVPFSDEIQAGVAAYSSAPFVNNLTLGEAYNQALPQFREQQTRAENNPMAYYPGMVAGAVGTGIGAARQLGKDLPKLAQFAARNPTIAAIGGGALSGGLYGAGAGTEGNRATSAGLGSVAGGAGGAVGGVLGQRVFTPLAQKAARLFKKTPAPSVTGMTVNEIAEQGQNLPSVLPSPQAFEAEARAMSKVQAAIQKDFPDNYEQVLNAWKQGDVTQADLYGSETRTLAQGAAQYPAGKKVAQKYFDAETLSSPERFKAAISNNISGVDNYYATVDDVISAGQARAKPFYEKAYQAEIPMPADGFAPEVQGAINAAKRKYPSELANLPDNSVKVLDYAKRVLDDNINTAKRAGQGNFVRNRTGIKNDLLAQMDAASPDYALARSKSGDYLSVAEAMDDGKDFMSLDAELMAKKFNSLGDQEKTAFKIGVGKHLRDLVEKRNVGENPYNVVFGSPQQKNRLMKILSPKEYKNLELSLNAEDRLFRMRNEILGNSSSVGKAVAAAQIADGGADALAALTTGGTVKSVGLGAIRSALKRSFDGLNDKTAEQVSRIIYETNPAKKLEILSRIAGDKSLTKAEKQIVKQVYFEANDIMSPRIAGSIAGGSIGGNPMKSGNSPARITVRPQKEQP